MTIRLAIMVALATSLIAVEGAPAAQQPDSLGARARRARTSATGYGARPRAALGTYESNRRTNILKTRAQKLRGLSPLKETRRGLLPDIQLSYDPTRYILDRRNLLRVRSPLAQSATAYLGRSVMSRDELLLRPPLVETAGTSADVPSPESTLPVPTSEPAPPESPLGIRAPRTVADVLTSKLESRGDEYLQIGIAYFRAGEFIRARQQFEMARIVWPDQPKPYIMCMFASYQVGDRHRALHDLTKAIGLASSLEDLRIEGFPGQFWPGADEAAAKAAFRRTVSAVNLALKSSGETTSGSILLAYYAWLNDDTSTAISAAEAAIGATADPDASAPLRRFRDWLTEDRAPAAEKKPTAG